MRLSVVKSHNTTSYYVIKDYNRNGKWTTKVVEKLGTHAELTEKSGGMDPLEWARAYVLQLNKNDKCNDLEYIAKYSSYKQLKKNEKRKYHGGYLFLQSLFSSSGLRKICDKIDADNTRSYKLSDLICMIVANRILDPSSEQSFQAFASDCLEKYEFNAAQISQALQVLTENNDLLQAELYKRNKKYIKKINKPLFIDYMNCYVHADMNGMVKRLYPIREHHHDPVVRMELLSSADGFPLAIGLVSINDDNHPISGTFREKILQDFPHSRIISRVDAVSNNYDNCPYNERYGQKHAFITSLPLPGLKDCLRNWAVDPNGWKLQNSDDLINLNEIDFCIEMESDDVYCKNRWINEDGLKQQLIISYSHMQKRHMSETRMKRSLSGVIDPRVREHFISEVGALAEVQYDGYTAILTNLDDDPFEIINMIKRRREIEAFYQFYGYKQIECSVCMTQENQILAHFFISYSTLLVYRLLENNIRQQLTDRSITGSNIIKTLCDMDFMESKGNGYIPTYMRTELTDALHDAFGFRTDMELIPEKEMRNIVRLTKTTTKKQAEKVMVKSMCKRRN